MCMCVQTMSVGCASGRKHGAEVCSSCAVAPRPSHRETGEELKQVVQFHDQGQVAERRE